MNLKLLNKEDADGHEKSWDKVEAGRKEAIKIAESIQSLARQLKKECDRLMDISTKMHLAAPELEDSIHSSPFRHDYIKTYIKQELRLAGFDFIKTGQATIADTKLKSI